MIQDVIIPERDTKGRANLASAAVVDSYIESAYDADIESAKIASMDVVSDEKAMSRMKSPRVLFAFANAR